MLLPNVAELIRDARNGNTYAPVCGPDRPRMAARLFEARDTIANLLPGIDWGSEGYHTLRRIRETLDTALKDYGEYADWAAAHARATAA